MHWFRRVMHEKCYEPVKRNHDGVRYHGHRFPIKGGISLREVMLRQMSEMKNPLFEQLVERAGLQIVEKDHV